MKTKDKPQPVGAPFERPVGRLRPKQGTAAAVWFVFGSLWLAGLALGDQIKAAGHDFSGAWAVLYGGMWMLMCIEVRKSLAALWHVDDASGKLGDWREP